MNAEEIRAALLDFTSSELTSHSAIVIGLSILLFTVADLFIGNSLLPQTAFPPEISLTSTSLRFGAVFCIFLFVTVGIIYSFGRLAYYGAIAHETISIQITPQTLEQLRKNISDVIGKKMVIKWFSGGNVLKAIVFSTIIGFIIDVILFLVLFLK